jgi:hypothetical protein
MIQRLGVSGSAFCRQGGVIWEVSAKFIGAAAMVSAYRFIYFCFFVVCGMWLSNVFCGAARSCFARPVCSSGMWISVVSARDASVCCACNLFRFVTHGVV